MGIETVGPLKINGTRNKYLRNDLMPCLDIRKYQICTILIINSPKLHTNILNTRAAYWRENRNNSNYWRCKDSPESNHYLISGWRIYNIIFCLVSQDKSLWIVVHSQTKNYQLMKFEKKQKNRLTYVIPPSSKINK